VIATRRHSAVARVRLPVDPTRRRLGGAQSEGTE